MRRSFFWMLLALPLLVGVSPPWPDITDGSGIPGMSGNKGNEDTLSYLLGLTEFASTGGSGCEDYYVSADAGGTAAEGDDDADGTSWATAWQSLCRADYEIENGTYSQCIRVWFDSGDEANDEWEDLTTELDCLDSAGSPAWDNASWDGSIGPPKNLGTMETPAAYVSASDPSSPFRMNMLELPQAQNQEDCAFGGSETLDCYEDDDGLFFGLQEEEFPSDTSTVPFQGGYLAVQNVVVSFYPPMPERTGSAVTKDIFGGNVISLNVDAGTVLPSQQVNLTSVHGGTDIHIQPKFTQRDTADLHRDCGGVVAASPLGCLGVSDGYVSALGGDGLCTGVANNAPWTGCKITSGIWDQLNPIIVPVEGSTIIISDQTYTYMNGYHSGDDRYDGPLATIAASSLYLLGPMTFDNGVRTENPEANGIRLAAAMGVDLTGVNPGTREAVMAFVNFGSAANPILGDVASEEEVIVIHDNGNVVENHPDFDLKMYGVRVAEADFGILELDDVLANSVNTINVEIYCSDFRDYGTQAIQIGPTASPVASALDNSRDITIVDTYFDEVGNVLQVGADVVAATHAAAIVDLDTYPELSCNGDETCATGWVEDGGLGAMKRVISAQTVSNRKSVCPTAWEFEFSNGVADAGYEAFQKNIRIPAFVAGASIKGFRFGAAD